MNVLQIVTREREVVATIERVQGGDITLEVFDERFTSELHTLLQNARNQGLSYKSAFATEQEGEAVLIDEQVIVSADDERFLAALSDHISSHSFNGQRLFALTAGAAGTEREG